VRLDKPIEAARDVPGFVWATSREDAVNLLIAIPTYNESKHVNAVVDRVKPYCSDILIIDDGSSDLTPAILGARKDIRVLRHARNQGYGQSLIDAFAYADREGFDWVITMDADGQHEAESIPDFVEAIRSGEWDMISGSRYLAALSNDDLPPVERRNINHRITTILNNLFGMELTDSFCGFKAHRTSTMVKLGLTEPGYAFPLQLWPRVWEAGVRMKEIAVRRIYNDPNRTFGADLDDAERRFRHYLNVLNAELVRMNHAPVVADLMPRVKLGSCCRG
jgi:glycosyltransferase involved in cell wall biosynthesis